MLIFKKSLCDAGAQSDSLILMEGERLELDVEEMVVDRGYRKQELEPCSRDSVEHQELLHP